MAQHKNAFIRYKALDVCFSNQYKRFYINDLIEYCSKVLSEYYVAETTVSRRQIFDDINFMKSEAGYDAPVESFKDGKKVYYRYSDDKFSILKQPLNPDEKNLLLEALETLSRINNVPGFDWVNSVQTKLQSGLNIERQNRQIISFEDNEFLIGLKYLNPLYQYILNNQTLDISYRSFKSEETIIYIISPYFLKQYNNRWFLFGWNNLENYLQNLSLDRIESIENSDMKFIENSINLDEYFEDIVGVSNDLLKESVQVKIELSENILPYIKSKPVHGSQLIKGNTLTLDVKLNYELQSLILSYGENMKVVEPEILLDLIRSRVNKIKNFY